MQQQEKPAEPTEAAPEAAPETAPDETPQAEQGETTAPVVGTSSSSSSNSTDKSLKSQKQSKYDTLEGVAADGSLMKYTVADLIAKEGKPVELDKSMSDTLKDRHAVESLTEMECVIPLDAVIQNGIATVHIEPTEGNVFAMLRSLAKHAQPEDSDAETNSLFDSDEDYEGERDDFFRNRAKCKKVKRLTTTKGIIDFKQYIKGTPGEVNWNLWIDIERACLIPDKNELNRCVQGFSLMLCLTDIYCVSFIASR